MKKFAAFLSIVLAVTFSAGLVIGANAPDKVVIKEIQKTKGPVPFDHKAHAAIAKECKVCHHKDEAGKEQKCSACHKDKTEGKTVSLKEAFHTTCKDCHQKDASKKAPTKCDGCHQK
jgi:hypothetical protein